MPSSSPHFQRPTDTRQLVNRIKQQDPDKTSAGEQKKALQPLLRAMIKVYRDESKLSQLLEVVEISSVAKNEDYKDLVAAYANTIINGTSDRNILDPKLLLGFSKVLRNAQCIEWASGALGGLMAALQSRLTTTIHQAGREDQYRLIRALSGVLDAMVENKISGIAREELHEPLRLQLKKLSDDEDLRMSQAADYALQALLGVPNDETKFQQVVRVTAKILKPLGRLAGAAATLDISKITDLISEHQDDIAKIPDLIEATVKTVRDIYALSAVTELFGGDQKAWYAELRYADLLIEAGAFHMLESFIQQANCRQDKHFLCGLFSLLEQAWIAGTQRDEVVRILHKPQISQLLGQSDSQHVLGWVRLVSGTVGQHEWVTILQSNSPQWFRWSQKKYTSGVNLSPEMRPESVLGDLLEEAWQKCDEAQTFYADAIVRQYYGDGILLKIERLSREALDMENCFINVATVAQPWSDSAQTEISPVPLSRRLRVDDRENLPSDAEVWLPGIFYEHDQTNNDARRPRRILIRGHAGVGKTTLCKAIMWSFLYNQLWSGTFDRLLWIPLRSLNSQVIGNLSSSYNLENLFYDRYFSQEIEGHVLAKALWKTINEPGHKSRTLFILDGLDEVSSQLNAGGDETAATKTLKNLLNQENVIVTSRPCGASLPPLDRFDLELETIGFKPYQVESYIRGVCRHVAAPMISFIRSHVLILGLLRIPIQLDAFCYTWDSRLNLEDPPKTMSALYEAIVFRLWRKDMVILDGMSDTEAQSLSILQVKRYILDQATLLSEASSLLGFLAFTGMCNDLIEFTARHRFHIKNCWEQQRDPPKITDKDLMKLSFLRTSDDASIPGHMTYHFLHRTYQDYFAAQYLVERWNETQLLWFSFNDNNLRSMSTREFLRAEKYNQRYSIMLRFVVGILHSRGCKDQLYDFFSILDAEPRDILGFTHQRLVMHCFNEVDSGDDSDGLSELRRNAKHRLSQWMRVDLDDDFDTGLASIAYEIECPEDLVEGLLREESPKMKKRGLMAISKRPTASESLLRLAATFLRDSSIRVPALYALSHHSRWAEIMELCIPMLNNKGPHVRASALVLLKISARYLSTSFPQELLTELLSVLQNDTNEDCRHAAAGIFSVQRKLPKDILESLIIKMTQEPSVFIGGPKESIGIYLSLQEQVETILAFLNEGDISLRLLGLQIFKSWPLEALSMDTIKKTASLMGDGDERVRESATNALRSRPSLPSFIVEDLSSVFQHADLTVRCSVARFLGTYRHWPDEMVKMLEGQVKDQSIDDQVRFVASQALIKQPNPPSCALETLERIAKGIDDNAHEALFTLATNSSSPWIVEALQLCFADKKRPVDVRRSAIKALSFQPNLSEPVIQAMLNELQEGFRDDPQTGTFVTGNLARQPNLPQPAVEALFALVEDRQVSSNMLANLSRRSNIPEKTLMAALQGLFDTEDYLTPATSWSQRAAPAAAKLFTTYPLPKGVLNSLISQLENKNKAKRAWAVYALTEREDFQVELPSLVLGCIKGLYSRWFYMSFFSPYSLVFADQKLCLRGSQRMVEVPFANGDQQKQFVNRIRQAQQACGIDFDETYVAYRAEGDDDHVES